MKRQIKTRGRPEILLANICFYFFFFYKADKKEAKTRHYGHLCNMYQDRILRNILGNKPARKGKSGSWPYV